MLENDRRVRFFGSYLDLLTMEQTVQAVDEAIDRRMPTQHVVINVAKLVGMQRDEALKNAVNSCRLINADGQGIVWGARLLGIPVPERVTGIDLFLKIVERASEKRHRLYFLGAREEVVKKVVDIFSGDYPELQIAGYRNGYFSDKEEEGVVGKIRESQADVLFVAMSSPAKEIFLRKYLHAMNVPFVMGVGGSFDVVAGVTQRAPQIMQRAGLEWFYRLLNEPRRMAGRYLTTNWAFSLMLVKALILGKEKCGCSTS